MTALYVALAQILGSLIVSKIQGDATDAATRQKLADSVADLWKQVNAAHVQIQTGEKNGTPS